MKIRLFTLGRADISISIGALMVVIAAVLMGRADDLALSMAALSLHEGAHTLAAMAAGVRPGMRVLDCCAQTYSMNCSLRQRGRFSACSAGLGAIA